MGKQQLAIQMVNRYKQLEHEIEIVTPGVYASVAIALHQAGMDNDQINDIFLHSQEIWIEHSNSHTVDDMIKKCQELTGIELYSGKSEIGEK